MRDQVDARNLLQHLNDEAQKYEVKIALESLAKQAGKASFGGGCDGAFDLCHIRVSLRVLEFEPF